MKHKVFRRRFIKFTLLFITSPFLIGSGCFEEPGNDSCQNESDQTAYNQCKTHCGENADIGSEDHEWCMKACDTICG